MEWDARWLSGLSCDSCGKEYRWSDGGVSDIFGWDVENSDGMASVVVIMLDDELY